MISIETNLNLLPLTILANKNIVFDHQNSWSMSHDHKLLNYCFPGKHRFVECNVFQTSCSNSDTYQSKGMLFTLCLKRHEVSEKIGLGSLAHFILDMKQGKLKCKKKFKIHAELTKLLTI